MSREKIFLLLFLPAVSNSAPWLQCPWEIYRQHLPWYRQTTPRMEAIDELMKAKTIIMIAHRTKTVQNADQILVVDYGQIVQKGTHEQFMQEEGVYRRFIEIRQKAEGWSIS